MDDHVQKALERSQLIIDECDKEVDLVIDMMMPISHEI